MHPRFLIGVVAAAAIAFAVLAFVMQLGSRNYGAGWWGPGMMGGYAMGPGMMGGYGYTMGPWMVGPNTARSFGYRSGPPYGAGQAPLNLSVDDVKAYFGRWLASQGNPHVKLGNISEKGADTITADILTTDKDGLVQRFAIDRHTGFVQPTED